MNPSLPKSSFVNANGIRLHYLDWGGQGQPLLFIPGMGCTAYIFDQFANRFTGQFRVLAFTRRGHGDSDYPETGYDADTLTEDLRQFLDELDIDQVILVGHSMGYVELSRFTALYPERVLKLVFLDASYSYNAAEDQAVLEKDPLPKLMPPWPEKNFYTFEEYCAAARRLNHALDLIWGPVMEEEFRHRVQINPPGKIEDKATPAIWQALGHTLSTYRADYTRIQVPLLCFFALQDGSDYLSSDYMTGEQQAQVLDFFKTEALPFMKRYIEQFRREVPHASIVEIPHGHHYCFIKQEKLVFNAMRAFLLDAQPGMEG